MTALIEKHNKLGFANQNNEQVSVIHSKKSQIKWIYFFLAFLLFLHSLQATTNQTSIFQNGSGTDSDFNDSSDLDIFVLSFYPGLNYGTATCTVISFENINGQMIGALVSSLTSIDLHLLINNQITQVTSLLFVYGDSSGLGTPLYNVLFFIGTISIDPKKYQETKKESSGNRNRQLIRETIKENPGINLREIQRTTNLAMGVIQYHIRYLESGEKMEVESLKLGKSKHFFASIPNLSVNHKVWFSLNRNQNIKNILDLLVTSPGHYSQKDISSFTGNSKSLISYYIRILRLNGIIEVENHRLRVSEEFIEITQDCPKIELTGLF